MQYEVLKFLRCPITKSDLRFELISECERTYSDGPVTEICNGLLHSESGFVFPVIDGIPRMLVEAIYDYSTFLEKHFSKYRETKEYLGKEHKGLLSYCIKKNRKTKLSFEFEWSFFNAQRKDRIWHTDTSKFRSVFLNEAGEDLDYFKNKTVIDIGSGHGVMTASIAELSKLAIGVELSKAVEQAYSRNQNKNAWYVQGDLQFLPFGDHIVDVLYSSGVIHHTNNTELSLRLIEPVLIPGGKICLWLYHPQKKLIHRLSLGLRKITRRLPVRVTFIFLCVFVFPFTFLAKKIKNKRPLNYREEIVDLLDGFTPEYRHETDHDLAIAWLKRIDYIKANITTENQFGFSITALKTVKSKSPALVSV